MVLRAKVCRMEAKGGKKEGAGGLGSFGPEPRGQQAPGADLQMRLLHGRGFAFNWFNIFAVRSHVCLTYLVMNFHSAARRNCTGKQAAGPLLSPPPRSERAGLADGAGECQPALLQVTPGAAGGCQPHAGATGACRLLQRGYPSLIELLIERFFFPQTCEHSLLKPKAEK